MQQPEPDPSEKRRQAETDLAALGRERDLFDGFWHNLFARGVRHFDGADADPSDLVEIWGRRIGRALAAVAFAGFCIYLYSTYVR